MIDLDPKRPSDSFNPYFVGDESGRAKDNTRAAISTMFQSLFCWR